MGITKTSSALSRWALSYNLRSQIADNTHTMFGLHQEDKFSHNESTPGRKDRDQKDKSSLLTILKQYKVFCFVFMTLPLKISSLMKFKSLC